MSARPLAAACAALAVALPPLASPAVAVPRTDAQDDARRRVSLAAGELEDSTAAVQAAAATLADVATRLPAARTQAALARGELEGARAKVSEAEAAVARAQLQLGAAQHRVDAANARLLAGRETVGAIARRSYQGGPLGDLRALFAAQSPQDLIDRAEMLRQVFKSQNEALHRMSIDRLHLAGAAAALEAQKRALMDARTATEASARRAKEVSDRADRAAAQVAELVSRRQSALADAKAARAADLAEYQAAQEASRRLAARLRALAAARAREAARNHSSTARASSARFLWPANGELTSRYGWREHPIYGDRRFHAGIDIGAAYGSAVWAGDEGTVVYAGPASGYGTLLVVSHGTVDGRDLSTGYAHMSAILVAEGEHVRRGQQVGQVGNEGNSTGPHLHFEVRLDGDTVDPLDWVSQP